MVIVVFHNLDPFSWCPTAPEICFLCWLGRPPIFFPQAPPQKRHALGLINCLLQRSDGSLDFFFLFFSLTLRLVYLDFRSFTMTFNALFFFFYTRSKILVTYGIFTGQATNWGVLLVAARRPCHEWLPRWPPTTPSCWDLRFLPHAPTHGQTVDKAERESFEGDFFFFFTPIQSVCMNTSIMMWCQWLIRTEFRE